MKQLDEWVAQILAIKPDRTLDEIYGAMRGIYTREQILTVWKPEEEELKEPRYHLLMDDEDDEPKEIEPEEDAR